MINRFLALNHDNQLQSSFVVIGRGRESDDFKQFYLGCLAHASHIIGDGIGGGLINMTAIKLAFCLGITFICAATLCAQQSPATRPAAPTAAEIPETAYLFTSFRGNGDGLHLGYSADGVHWFPLAGDRAFIKPIISGKLMRDPCIVQGADGTFHLVWTTGWYEKDIGHASSKDLINWSEQKAIPVMTHEPTAQNSWAPELFWDDKKSEWIIFWATTIPGRFEAGEAAGDNGQNGVKLNHRIYFTTTRDFSTFAPTKVFFDPGFSVIDSTLVKVGDTYYMVFKDETRTPPKKYLRVASSRDAQGPYSIIAESFTPPGLWVEGPSVIQTGDEYICYFDMYRNSRYGAMKTKDFLKWDNITDQLNFNVPNVRHGTAFKVKKDVLLKLMATETAPAAP